MAGTNGMGNGCRNLRFNAFLPPSLSGFFPLALPSIPPSLFSSLPFLFSHFLLSFLPSKHTYKCTTVYLEAEQEQNNCCHPTVGIRLNTWGGDWRPLKHYDTVIGITAILNMNQHFCIDTT